jgi:two-component system chemotaxis sensor kinase CheA
MASLEQLKQTFFDECTELLQDIETGLTEMREGGVSDDTVNAVFRAVHSVKGGAGIFGFSALVEFAHVFETVLDEIRHGSMTATPEVIDVLLTASDVLCDLVTMSRSGEAITADFGEECRNALQQLINANGGEAEDDNSPAPADFEGFDFVPVRSDTFDDLDFVPVRADSFEDAPPDDGKRSYAITFRPKPEMLKNANEPLYILRELRKLGDVELTAHVALPPLTEIEPDHPYVGWTGTLRTAATRAQIDEVFEFVVGDCDLEITESVTAATASAFPVEAAALPSPLTEAAPPLAPADMPTVPASPDVEAPPPPAAPSAGKVEPAPGARAQPTKPAATTTRVDLEKIDRVVNMVGELVIAQAMLGQIVQGLPEDVAGRLAQMLEEVVFHTRELKDSVMSMRAAPVGTVFQRMPRLIRELAAKTGKKVRLETVGENTEVDRSIIERLSDPLTHIIRNSVDHGIESPADRLAAGKNEEGTVRLAAEHRGGRIVIEVRDDGAGINSERVLKKAREKGLIGPDASLTDDEINNLVFMPGFSTAEAISDISGRGVGMDVVRSNIQDIGGRITLKSERGRGMIIQLALPLTLAVMDGMVIKVGGETYVMPMPTIVECLRPSPNDIQNLIGSRGMLQLRGDLVPLVHLSDLLDVRSAAVDSSDRVVIITEAGDESRFGLIVDELCGHQQVVIKSIEESYGSVPGIAGATILGNGRVAFILDVDKLSDLAVNEPPSFGSAGLASSGATSLAMN